MFTGLWQRTLLSRPGAADDRESLVYWLQASRFFVDIRLPVGRPDFAARCVRALKPQDVRWLSRQEGFAGTFESAQDVGEWNRALDVQPAQPLPDRGRLMLAGDALIEVGTHARYMEEWRRRGADAQPVGLRLIDGSCTGYLVIVGGWFMYARDRPRPVPAGLHLANIVHACKSLRDQQDLVDIEISFGETVNWRIVHSTLPFREGACLGPRLRDRTVLVNDLTPEGDALTRAWHIIEADLPITADALAQVLQSERA